jgi:hypothetical protein
MADAKISALPIASISGGDPIPFTKISTSVTSATNFRDFSNTILTSPSITGNAVITLPFSVMGVGVSSVTGTNKLVLDTSPTVTTATINEGTVRSPSVTGNMVVTLPMSVMGIGINSVTGTNKLVLDTSPTIVTATLTRPTESSPSVTGDATFAQNITAGSVIGVNQKVGGGIGYVTGAGSIVGQGTGGRSVTIVSNAPTGALVLTSSVMSASIISSFIVANSAMGVTDFMMIQHIGGGTPGIYTFAQSTLGGGNTLIKMRNNQNAAITESITIGYVVVKGAQS